MAKRIQLRRGTTAQTNAFTGAVGEVTVDTDKDVLVVHDGVTAGGFPEAARANANGTISLIKKDGTIAGSINAAGLFNNTLTSTAADQALTAAQGKVLQDTKLDKTAITASGSAPMYVCRAWVNFNGTGTVAIRSSGNVSSITDNGTGDYTVNFTSALQDANYAWIGSVQGDATGYARSAFSNTADVNTTTSFKVKTGYSSGGSSALQDFPTVSVVVFR